MINVSIRFCMFLLKIWACTFFFIAGLVRPEYNWIGQNGGDEDSWKH